MSGTLILAGSILIATAMLCVVASRAWHGWLELKRAELDARRDAPPEHDISARIELAAVRERLKKLEAIASGVEL
jgi:hypothetical protein